MSKENQEWYLLKNRERYGPYSWEQLQDFIKENRLLADDLIWSQSLSAWTPAKQVPGLLTRATQTSPQVKTTTNKGAVRSPKKKKKGTLIVGGFLLILLIAGGVLAFNSLWRGWGIFTGDPTLEAVTCREVNEKSEAIEVTDSFNQEDQEIYLAVLVNNAREGSTLTAEWWYMPSGEISQDTVEGAQEQEQKQEQEGAYQEKIRLVGYDKELSRGDNRTHFSILQPPYNWKTGDYQVTLELDQTPVLTVPFKVENK